MHKNLLCDISANFAQALQKVDSTGQGIVCLHDDSGAVVGILTDGDIRRATLQGCTLDTPVKDYVNYNFKWLPEGLDEAEYLKTMTNARHLIVLGKGKKLVALKSYKDVASIPIASPCLTGNELNYVTQCVKSNWISSQGPFVKKFEQDFAAYHNIPFALTTSNGTTALHLALVGLGIVPGDEVIVPVSTFGASANAVIHAGAVPVFVDICSDTWCIDAELIEQALTPQTKAIMPVHLYGHPANMRKIMDIAQKHNLLVIEDCAESLGAFAGGKATGTFGHAGCFSFFSNKVITTGEGGMVITSDEQAYKKMTQYRDHGTSPTRKYWHEFPGFNYRLTNLQSAIGLAQLERIGYFLEIRKHIAARYTNNLKGIKGIKLPATQPGCTNIHWLYTIELTPQSPVSRDTLLQKLHALHIDSRPFFPALFRQPAYGKYARHGEFPVGQRLEATGLSLPTSTDLTNLDIDRVCEGIVGVFTH